MQNIHAILSGNFKVMTMARTRKFWQMEVTPKMLGAPVFSAEILNLN